MQLTKNQKLMLDIEKVVGGSIGVICGSVFYNKKLDINLMEQAANELFRLNDALRIRIVQQGTEIVQQITEFEKRNIEVIRVANKNEAKDYAQKQAYIPFDMNESLCEIKLINGDDFCGVLYKLHHIISDAWTLSLLATQFNQIITAQPVEAFSYKMQVEADNKYLKSKRYLKDKEFYIEQFSANSEPVLFSEKNVDSLCATRKTFAFSSEKVKAIQQFTKDNLVSMAVFFLSVVSVYYSRTHNNCERFYVGLPVINRTGPVEKKTAGLFINTAPIVIRTDNNSTFSKLTEDVELATMSTMRHQKYNYEDVLSSLDDEFDFKGKLFDVIFSYQNAQILGDNFESTWYHNGMQKESIQIHIDDRDNTGILKIHYDYQTEKFTEKDIEDFHSHFCNILIDALEHPGKKICELEMLSAEEKQKVLYDFNDTEYHYSIPDNSTLFSLFEKTAEENKDKVCIKTAEGKLTFGELRFVSENLDARLREITDNKKSIVAVIAERSPEMYAAIYGIIRGGNAYLPIDPKYPQDRIEYILKDSNAAAVVTQNKLINLAGDVPTIDMTAFLYSNFKENNIPVCAAEPDDTAYVIYTSGSTGNPKGARISHKSAINRILWMHDKYPLGINDVILQKTPYTFDVSVWELFWWALCGGSLAASKPDEHFLPAKIIDEVYNNKATHLHFVPSVFDLFLTFLESNEAERSKFETVKYVFLSGEALSASLVQRFYDMYDCNKVTLHNLYGPTECAVDVTYYDCLPTDINPVPIGKPIHNTQMYVLDKYMNPLPIGIAGELCIAGANVGQGYLNRSELTTEKFINNPYGEGKLYKTGDLAYWREDGNIIFCGRIDSQIKLGGQRIEIGEIEAVLSEVDGVESVAVVINKTNGQDMLVAFFTGECKNDVIIKERCLSKLPRYMVPSAFVHCEHLPLNQSGKLDRKSLSLEPIKFVQSVEGEAPINDTEKFICESFSRILGKAGIGRRSDFFELGGTSLLMISLLSEKEFENISAADFIRNSTPFKLSSLMNDKKDDEYKYLEVLYDKKGSDKVMIFLPFASGGAEAYGGFINGMKEKNNNMSLYFIRYLHSIEECRKAAKEVAEAFKNKEINFYSHCVGSAVALQIIRELETCDIEVKNYFAGASIPLAMPMRRNIWNGVPDKILKAILSKAGAQLGSLSQEVLAELLKNFRRDTDFASVSYCETGVKVKTPVKIILSKKDIFTKNYRQAEKIWSKYAERVNNVCFINSESHYFQRDNIKELVDIIELTLQSEP